MTSLSRQLSRLRVPQTSVQKEKKGKVSFLYDYLEAKSIDADTHYAIAVSGLQSLIQLDIAIDRFSQTLFNESSKTLDRALQSSEANEELDNEIEFYLFSVVSKYFLLNSTHKTIEWLIYRYGVHQYNTDALLAATLPYHETRFFARLLQTCGQIRVETNHWFWLRPLLKNGSPLPKLTLITHCTSDPKFLRFICDYLLKCLKIDSKNNTFLAFFVSTIINIIERKTNESIISIIVPIVVKGLKSKNDSFRKASNCLCAHICSRIRLEPKVVNKFLKALAKRFDPSMSDEIVLTIEMIVRSQELEGLPSSLVAAIPDHILIECHHRYKIRHMVSHFLPHLIRDCNQVASKERLIVLLEELTLTPDLVNIVVQTISKMAQTEESRILTDTFRQVLSLLEIRYPLLLDESLSQLDSLSSIAPFLNHFRYLLLDNCKIPLMYGIINSNESIRSEAIDYLIKNFNQLIQQRDNSANSDVKTLLSNALKVKSPQTLITIFGLKEKMFAVFSADEMRDICLDLLAECHVKEKLADEEDSTPWHQLKNSILATYCSEVSGDGQSKLSVIFPYLMPLSEADVISLSIIMNSNLGKQNPILNSFRKKFKKSIEIEDKDVENLIVLITTEMATFCIENPNFISEETFLPYHKSLDHMKSCILSLMTLEQINRLTIESRLRQKSSDLTIDLIRLMLKTHKLSKPKKSVILFGELVRNCTKTLKKNRISVTNVVFVMKSLIETIDWTNETNAEFEWFWFKQKASEHYLYKLFDLIFNNCYDNNVSKSDTFRQLLMEFNERLITRLGYDFFAPLWSDNKDLIWQSRSLAVTSRLPKSELPFSEITGLSLVIALRSPLSSSRESALKTMAFMRDSKTCFNKLFKKLITNCEAIVNDENVVNALIAEYFSESKNSELKNRMLTAVTDADCPQHLKSEILLLLNQCYQLLPELLPKFEFNMNSSPIDKNKMKIIGSLISFFSHPNIFDNCLTKDDNIFKFFIKCLKTNSTKQKAISVLNKPIFESIKSVELKTNLLNALLDIIAENSDKNIHKLVKKFLNSGDLISSLLSSLVPIDEPIDICEPETKKSLLTESHFTMESIVWKKFILTLEIIATKKHLSKASDLVDVLFSYLKKTFIIEAKSSVEYLRQLLLNSLVNCIKQSDEELSFAPIESVVECLRESQHKETQKTALILISSVAHKYKKEIMDYVITIFTFIGTNLLHCDDQYSIEVVYDTMEAIIPILLTDANESKELVINVFIDSLADIPAHRRLKLLSKLLEMLGQSQHLAFILIKVVERIFSRPKSEREPFLNLMAALCSKCTIQIQIEAINKLMDLFINDFCDDRRILSNSDQNLSENDKRLIAQSLAQMILTIISSQEFIQTIQKSAWDHISEQLEVLLHRLIVLINKFNVSENQLSPKDSNPNRKRIRNILNQILLQFNCLLPNEQLIGLILQLFDNDSLLIRRKALEMLNEKLDRFNSEPLGAKLIEDLLVRLSGMCPTPSSINQLDESRLHNAQLSMISIKILSKHMTENEDMERIFYQLLEQMIATITAMKADISANLKASCILCLTQVMVSLSNKAVPLIPFILPIILNNFDVSDELIIVSNIASVSKISQNFAKFLSPYLTQLIVKLIATSVRHPNVKAKIRSIWQIFAKEIQKRVLLSAIDSAFDEISGSSHDLIIELMSLLKLTFETLNSKSDVNAIYKFVKNIIIKSLDIRNRNQSASDLNRMIEVEDASNNAFAVFIPKMTEITFRPLFFKLYDWAIRDNGGKLYHRIISFYRLVNMLAHKLKSLFCIFIGPSIVNNCAQLLSEFHSDESSRVSLDSERSNLLIISIMSTLANCFLYDTSGAFLNKERIQALAKPLVNQLNNTLGSETHFRQRVDVLCLCIKNMVESNRDETVIKHFNYQLLLQTRHSSPEVRLAAISVVHRLILSAGEDYLPVIPETIPFISELNEDDSNEIEESVKKVVTDLEQIIGEPISKYL